MKFQHRFDQMKTLIDVKVMGEKKKLYLLLHVCGCDKDKDDGDVPFGIISILYRSILYIEGVTRY